MAEDGELDALKQLLRSPRGEDVPLRMGLHGGVLEVACEETSVRFPTIGGVPCLFADFEAEIERWRSQFDEFDRQTAQTANAVLAQLAGGGVRPDVRRRLQRLHSELERHRGRIAALLDRAGLNIGGNRREARAHSSPTWEGRSLNPAEARLDAYLHQIHRDWGWQDNPEIEAALETIVAACGGARVELGTMLVFGGGSARLPYELHRRLAAKTTVVLDVDILAVSIAARMLAGESLELAEFPSGPRDGSSTVVERRLAADPDALDRTSTFHLVLADGLRPPVARHAFDTVLTPWFIDQVPTDLASFVDVVRGALAPGGTWINHGPLIYEPRHTMLIHRYTADEVEAILRESGFEVEFLAYERQAFLQSPASTRGRTETILTFVATKRDAVVAERDSGDSPAWLTDPSLPIVAWPGLAKYQPPHPMFAATIALIDGRRSVDDIAAVMVEKHGLPAAAAAGGVQAALAEMLRATQDAE